MSDRIQLLPGIFSKLQDRRDCIAILTLQPLDHPQAFFDLVQAAGIELNPLQIISQGDSQVAEQIVDRFSLFDQLSLGGIQARQPMNRMQGSTKSDLSLAGASGAPSSKRAGFLRQRSQPFGIGQAVAFLAQLLFFTGLQTRRVNFFYLIRQDIAAPGCFTFGLLQGLQSRPAQLAETGRSGGNPQAVRLPLRHWW